MTRYAYRAAPKFWRNFKKLSPSQQKCPGKDRSAYRQRLRQAIIELDLSLLTYNITSNHVHLVAYAERSDQVARLMQQASGEFARDSNRRKSRSGAFWEGRYHATMVDSGEPPVPFGTAQGP